MKIIFTVELVWMEHTIRNGYNDRKDNLTIKK